MSKGNSRKARILKNNQNTNTQPVQKAMSLDDVMALENMVGISKQLALEKAFSSSDITTILKAQEYLRKTEKKQQVDIKSIVVDPLDTSSSFGYKHKPYSLSYDMLRGMAKTHIINSIIKTRKAQVINFSEPQPDKYSSGFVIDKRNKWRSTEKDKQLTKQEQKRADELIQFVLDCGNTDNIWHRDNFTTFLGKIIDDALTMDQATFEVVSDRVGRPIEYFATDGATYRIADSFNNENEVTDQELVNGHAPSYVQVIQGQVYSSFYAWELCFGTRNPSTDIRTNGYGKAELEDMISLITSILNADAYNANFFKVGSSPQGILTYSGNVNQNTLESFRQQWQAQVAGVANSHKIPMVNADKVNFIPTHIPNRDMEYGRFQEFLIKCGCAMYLIDPSEVGFNMSGNTDGNSGLGGDATKEKLKYSKDKGLKPLLKHIAYWINRHIIWRLDPEYEFRFVGIDGQEDKQAELEADIKMAGTFKGLQETRDKYNLGKLAKDDMILNPIWMQNKMSSMMGDPESNQAVDEMDGGDNGDANPFMKSLQSDLQKILS